MGFAAVQACLSFIDSQVFKINSKYAQPSKARSKNPKCRCIKSENLISSLRVLKMHSNDHFTRLSLSEWIVVA